MSSYISRVFARPHPTQGSTPPRTTNDREPELNHLSQDYEAATNVPPAPTAHTMTQPSYSSASKTLDKPSEDQFQIMLSSILTQNSNLLAQNTEQARVIDRLSICLSEAEAGQKELREEMRGMFRGIMDILGGLKPTPAAPSGGAGTPTSAVADVGTSINEMSSTGRNDFRDLITQDQDHETGGDGGLSQGKYWSRDKGKQKDIQGVDPNVLQRQTFTSLDTPTERGDIQAMDMDVWNNDRGDEGDDMLNSDIRPNRRQSTVEGMSATQLSAIAQQVIDMQEEEDEARPRSGSTIEEDPTTPTRGSRPIRQSASRSRNHSSLLPDQEGSSQKDTPEQDMEGKGSSKKEAKAAPGRKRKTTIQKPKKMIVPKAKRQRTFNGRVSMTARPLGRGDGQKRGEGVWPEKGQNTVKGNMQEIACDICNGRVHWACAGLEDNSVAPDEWNCPDCENKIANGEPKDSIERAPQTHCVRPTCILREKKKIVMKEGDADQFYVEKFIGRRAVGRRPDGTSRIFEYLVKWLQWPTDTSTWEHEINLPSNNHYADDFLTECEIYNVSAKKRVALLPEALRWFDEDGDLIETNENADDEDEEMDEQPGVGGDGHDEN